VVAANVVYFSFRGSVECKELGTAERCILAIGEVVVNWRDAARIGGG
jgi:hypothetical protein